MAWCLDMGVPWPAPHVLWYTDPGWTVWARKPACPALGTADRLGVGPETHHAGRWPQDTASRVSVLFSRCSVLCWTFHPSCPEGGAVHPLKFLFSPNDSLLPDGQAFIILLYAARRPFLAGCTPPLAEACAFCASHRAPLVAAAMRLSWLEVCHYSAWPS